MFIVGIGIMTYPAISNYLSECTQGEIIDTYKDDVEQIADEDKRAIKEKAMEYNRALLGTVVLTDPFDEDEKQRQDQEYLEILNIREDGMMGYVEIPSIDVYLPIYHGTKAKALDKGVGHLSSTSLPVGGIGTHTVLSAHRGIPSARLFTDLPELELGEVFYLKVLGETLAYETNQIKVVEPQNTQDLLIDIDKDYVTLLTCTPYGVNSHRLLVRGSRIPYEEETRKKIEEIKTESKWRKTYRLAIAIGVEIVLILLLIRAICSRRRKKV